MSKSLRAVLAEFGYEAWPSQYPRRKRVMRDGKLIGYMSVGEMWNFLKFVHPEYFEAVE